MFVAVGLVGCEPKLEPCTGAEPVVDAKGHDTGYVRCDDGSVNRAARVELAEPRPGTCALTTEPSEGECRSDADCQGNSRCDDFSHPDDGDRCRCVSFCRVDGDCDADQACVTPEVQRERPHTLPVCARARCSTNADCESNECGVATYHSGCGDVVELTCRSDGDVCRGNDECSHDGNYCVAEFDGIDNYACHETQNCDIGRPFRVDGRSLVAAITPSSDWARGPSVAAHSPRSELTPTQRRVLAEHWQRMAVGEHASVASFARFSLHLLAHAAPPDLLVRTANAMADEVEHARRAFALASRFGGEAIGPGSLAIDEAVQAVTRREMITALVEEACVGETLAVAEAKATLDRARDPKVCEALEIVVRDETEHAALAWRALRWAIGDDTGLREHARGCFAAAINEVLARDVDEAIEDEMLAEHGCPSRGALARARRDGLISVVIPAMQGLLGEVDVGDVALVIGSHVCGTTPV